MNEEVTHPKDLLTITTTHSTNHQSSSSVPPLFGQYLLHRISSSKSSDTHGCELDSHADSAVVGKHCCILRKTGKITNVRGFTDDLGSGLSVPFVDAVVTYEDDMTDKVYLLIIKNALYVESMDNHLIPPFLMRLARIEVDECPKFLSPKPCLENHSIYFRSYNVRIPLSLNNTISYIPTRKPTHEEMNLMSTYVISHLCF